MGSIPTRSRHLRDRVCGCASRGVDRRGWEDPYAVEARPERWFIAPYFWVPDVVSAAHYCRDTLGFTFNRFWGEPASFCMVERGSVVIMLAQIDDAAMVRPNSRVDREGGAWDAYVWVPDADALHIEFVARGATIARGLCDQEYGCRDFEVLDCNGYRLCFGHLLA